MFNFIRENLFKSLNKPSEDKIIYLINDSGLPEFKKTVPVQPMQTPAYDVIGYKGGGYPLNSKEGRAAQVFTVITETMKWVNKHAPYKLKNWASKKPLKVNPEAGKQVNAYYYRDGMKFFFYNDCYTALSSDIVCHELGHAIFDSYKPTTWSMTSVELWSFHEAFGDIVSVITTLQNKEVVKQVLEVYKKDNLASRIGEEIGNLMFKLTKGKDGRSPLHLRNVAERYYYTNPQNLSKEGSYAVITAEPHSFSRVMSSCLYEILVRMYELKVSKGLKKEHAVEVALNLFSKYLLEAITIVPSSPNFYTVFAQSMLIAIERNVDEENKKLVQDIFKTWNILKEWKKEFKMLSSDNEIETIKLKNEINVISSLSHNPLYEVEIDIPISNRKESINSAQICLDILHKNDKVGEGKNFEVKNNKLTRNYFNWS